MNKSQVRRLARDHANGMLEREEYLRRRRWLIDGIVDGSIPIEREIPPPPPPPPAPGPGPDVHEEPAAALAPRRVSPLYIGIGVVVVVAVAWALWPAPEAPPPRPQDRAAAPEVTPERQASPARTLVENFLAMRDWGESSVDEFRGEWSGLEPSEQEEARGAPWFRRFSKALRDEIKTQKALLEFDKSGEASATGARLVALGEFLGLGDSLPDFPAGPASAPATAAGAPAAAAAEAPVSPPEAPTGSQWFSSLDDDHYTLQLFALKGLEKVERLLRENDQMQVHIIDLENIEPRYRVFYGDFATEDAAQAAHASLPESVRRAQPLAYAKRVGDLRAAFGLAGASRTGGGPLAAENAERYTLQLFASDNRENVDRLVQTYPALDLKVHAAASGDSRYRVLYGSFASEADARLAGESLPRAILDDTGTPLVKSIAELH